MRFAGNLRFDLRISGLNGSDESRARHVFRKEYDLLDDEYRASEVRPVASLADRESTLGALLRPLLVSVIPEGYATRVLENAKNLDPPS